VIVADFVVIEVNAPPVYGFHTLTARRGYRAKLTKARFLVLADYFSFGLFHTLTHSLPLSGKSGLACVGIVRLRGMPLKRPHNMGLTGERFTRESG
jgi:hypothetical protein